MLDSNFKKKMLQKEKRKKKTKTKTPRESAIVLPKKREGSEREERINWGISEGKCERNLDSRLEWDWCTRVIFFLDIIALHPFFIAIYIHRLVLLFFFFLFCYLFIFRQ